MAMMMMMMMTMTYNCMTQHVLLSRSLTCSIDGKRPTSKTSVNKLAWGCFVFRIMLGILIPSRTTFSLSSGTDELSTLEADGAGDSEI